MGFERESFDKLMKVVWGKKSQMQQAMSRDSKGEPFIIRELEFKGAQTPSQLATALKVTSGRISTLLAALEKKGLIEREVDPNDRRIVHVNLTEQGRAKAKQQREDMRDAVCWVFSQMGGASHARIRGSYRGICHIRDHLHPWPAPPHRRRSKASLRKSRI